MENYLDTIRNFCIIAHIDHGKSTLADRMLQLTKTVQDREFRDQLLDSMDLGTSAALPSSPILSLWLTPPRTETITSLTCWTLRVMLTLPMKFHVVAACEGALVVVDACQGVEAQTVANVYLAIENNLEIIPILNKLITKFQCRGSQAPDKRKCLE